MSFIYVGIGGALGAMARFGVSIWLKTAVASGFPWATLSVNIIGSLLMGLLMGWLARSGNEGLRLFLAVGVLGGFTTFSAFSMELVALLERREALMAVLYASGSLLGGIAAFMAGYMLLRSLIA